VDSVSVSYSSLTEMESKVLSLMRLGMTNRQIADELCRSEFTVKTHVQRILAKLGARNRVHACLIPREQQV
jgi:DNA-binding NarL/FixJ family response regulator